MRNRWTLGIVGSCTGVLLAATGPFGIGGAAAEDNVAPSAPEVTSALPDLIANGVAVLDGPLSGADVIIRLWPDDEASAAIPEGERASLHLVGATKTDDQGRYSLALDPADIPASFINEQNGMVDVELILATADVQMRWLYSAKAGLPGTPAEGHWVLPTQTEDSLSSVVNTRLDMAKGTVWELADDPLEWADDELNILGDVTGMVRETIVKLAVVPISNDVPEMLERAAQLGRTSETVSRNFDRAALVLPMDDSWCGLRKVKTIYNRSEKFLTVRGTSLSKATVKQWGSNEHTLGVALDWSSTAAGTSWSAGGSKTIDFSVSATQGGLTGMRDMYNAVNYTDWRDPCSGPTYRKVSGYYDLVSKYPLVTSKTLPYCTFKYAGYDLETQAAKNVTYSTGVSLPYISVSAQAGYDNGVDLLYSFTGKAKLCWSNEAGWPSSSRIWTYAN